MTSRITLLAQFRLTTGRAATAAAPFLRESDVQAFFIQRTTAAIGIGSRRI